MNEDTVSTQLSLSGQRVLVTRPALQAAGFIRLITERGGQALGFPTIEIEPLPLQGKTLQPLINTDHYDLLVFISANAVRIAVDAWRTQSIPLDSIRCALAAIGKATSAALQNAGLRTSIQSEAGFDSESLLKLDALQADSIKHKRLLIIKGEGGRKALCNVLQDRGAVVETVDVYRRQIPVEDGEVNRQQLQQHWQQAGISHITVTSNESLQNLYSMVPEPGRTDMLKTPLVVPSTRSEQLARELGFSMVCVSTSAHDHDMLEALMRCNNKT